MRPKDRFRTKTQKLQKSIGGRRYPNSFMIVGKCGRILAAFPYLLKSGEFAQDSDIFSERSRQYIDRLVASPDLGRNAFLELKSSAGSALLVTSLMSSVGVAPIIFCDLDFRSVAALCREGCLGKVDCIGDSGPADRNKAAELYPELMRFAERVTKPFSAARYAHSMYDAATCASGVAELLGVELAVGSSSVTSELPTNTDMDLFLLYVLTAVAMLTDATTSSEANMTLDVRGGVLHARIYCTEETVRSADSRRLAETASRYEELYSALHRIASVRHLPLDVLHGEGFSVSFTPVKDERNILGLKDPNMTARGAGYPASAHEFLSRMLGAENCGG